MDGWELTTKGLRKFFGVMETFSILVVVVIVTQAYMYPNSSVCTLKMDVFVISKL